MPFEKLKQKTSLSGMKFRIVCKYLKSCLALEEEKLEILI